MSLHRLRDPTTTEQERLLATLAQFDGALIMTDETADLRAEITRLRTALELLANPDNWNTVYDPRLGPGQVWIWANPDLPTPIELARKTLEGP